MAQTVKNLSSIQETWVLSLDQEDFLVERNGYTLQYFCLEESMDRVAWWVTVHEVAKSQTWPWSQSESETCSLLHLTLFVGYMWEPRAQVLVSMPANVAEDVFLWMLVLFRCSSVTIWLNQLLHFPYTH